MQKPFFSVIIPTLDEEKYLPSLLHDLHKQTFHEYEIIIVDGKSKDRTQEIVQLFTQEHPQTMLLISKKRNVGMQRNLGAKYAKGSMLVFLDADTRIPRYFLEGVHYHLMRRNVDAWATEPQADTNDAKDKLSLRFYNSINDVALLIKKPFVVGACIGCKKNVFVALHGFDEALAIGEDWDFIHRLLVAPYSFTIFTDPHFVLSFRRFRKEGMFHMINHNFISTLRAVLNEKITGPVASYPMLGGSYFMTPKKKSSFSLSMKNFVTIFSKMSKQQKKNGQTILTQLKTYFPE